MADPAPAERLLPRGHRGDPGPGYMHCAQQPIHDYSCFANCAERADDELTADGDAVLLATVAGPVPVGDVQQEWGVRWFGGTSGPFTEAVARSIAASYPGGRVCQRVASPWVVADV